MAGRLTYHALSKDAPPRRVSIYTSFPDPADPSVNTPLLPKGAVVVSKGSGCMTTAGVWMQGMIFNSVSFLSQAVTRCMQFRVKKEKKEKKVRVRRERGFQVHVKLHALEAFYRLGQIPSRLGFTQDEIRLIVHPARDGLELEQRLMRLWRDIQVTQSLLRKSRHLEPCVELGREVLATEQLAHKVSQYLVVLWMLRQTPLGAAGISRTETAVLFGQMEERTAALERLRAQLWNDVRNQGVPLQSQWEVPPNPMSIVPKRSVERRLRLMQGMVEERDLYR